MLSPHIRFILPGSIIPQEICRYNFVFIRIGLMLEVGPLTPHHSASSGCGWIAANMLTKQSRKANKGWSSIWGIGCGRYQVLTMKHSLLRNVSQGLRLRRILWNHQNNGESGWDLEVVRSLSRSCALKAHQNETCKLDSVGVQNVKWVSGGTGPTDN
jgi:hypothetical protein